MYSVWFICCSILCLTIKLPVCQCWTWITLIIWFKPWEIGFLKYLVNSSNYFLIYPYVQEVWYIKFDYNMKGGNCVIVERWFQSKSFSPFSPLAVWCHVFDIMSVISRHVWLLISLFGLFFCCQVWYWTIFQFKSSHLLNNLKLNMFFIYKRDF